MKNRLTINVTEQTCVVIDFSPHDCLCIACDTVSWCDDSFIVVIDKLSEDVIGGHCLHTSIDIMKERERNKYLLDNHCVGREVAEGPLVRSTTGHAVKEIVWL